MNEPTVARCWCCPVDKMFLMAENPCTWPDCLNGHRTNPQLSVVVEEDMDD